MRVVHSIICRLELIRIGQAIFFNRIPPRANIFEYLSNVLHFYFLKLNGLYLALRPTFRTAAVSHYRLSRYKAFCNNVPLYRIYRFSNIILSSINAGAGYLWNPLWERPLDEVSGFSRSFVLI